MPPKKPSPADDARAALGRRAEALVAAWLERRGYVVVARNARVGRLELDVVARRPGLLVFVEVRARSSSRFMKPWESVDRAKRERLRRAAGGWMAEHGGAPQVRFDVASVVLDTTTPRFDYFEGAF